MEVDRSAAWQSWVGGRFNNFRGNLHLRPNVVPGSATGRRALLPTVECPARVEWDSTLAHFLRFRAYLRTPPKCWHSWTERYARIRRLAD